MLGVVNKAIQDYVCHAHGRGLWLRLIKAAQLPNEDIEPMLMYDDLVTYHLIDALVQETGKLRQDMLDDLGTFLVTPPQGGQLRRLLRFGGATFEDFLVSLADLNDRVDLALPDLDLPKIWIDTEDRDQFRIGVDKTWQGFASVLQGILRAMADDYGNLVFIDIATDTDRASVIEVILVERNFAQGAEFRLVD